MQRVVDTVQHLALLTQVVVLAVPAETTQNAGTFLRSCPGSLADLHILGKCARPENVVYSPALVAYSNDGSVAMITDDSRMTVHYKNKVKVLTFRDATSQPKEFNVTF